MDMNISTINGSIAHFEHVVPSPRDQSINVAPPPKEEQPAPALKTNGLDVTA